MCSSSIVLGWYVVRSPFLSSPAVRSHFYPSPSSSPYTYAQYSLRLFTPILSQFLCSQLSIFIHPRSVPSVTFALHSWQSLTFLTATNAPLVSNSYPPSVLFVESTLLSRITFSFSKCSIYSRCRILIALSFYLDFMLFSFLQSGA